MSGSVAQCGVDEDSNRPFEVVSAQQFARGLQQDTVVHICLVEPVNAKPAGKLNYIHHAAHGSETIGIKSEASERLLYDLEQEFPQAFVEPVYPISKGHDPFHIKLVDEPV